jgi:phage repressor protein C with HTH and peptisase S24 domain
MSIDRIKTALLKPGKSKGGLASALGIHQSQITHLLKGGRKLKAEEVPLIAEYLGLSQSELWENFNDTVRRVPLGQEFEPDADFVEDQTRTSAAEKSHRRSLQPGEVIEREVTAGLGIGGDVGTIMIDGVVQENVRAIWRLPPEMVRSELQSRETDLDFITVEGDSMSPTLSPGDRVLVNRAMSRPGDGVFVIHDGLGPSVKRLEVLTGTSPLRIAIISDNPHHTAKEIMAEDLAVIGRVIGRFSRM